jgi:hypothetical protein
MEFRIPEGARSFVLLGEAGCGKSEIAVNLARRLAAGDRPVHLFDLDMTKPLFRTRDLGDSLAEAGVTLHFEEQFMDAPTVSGGVNRLLRDPDALTVLDVGGDYIGARSIGGYAPLLNKPETAVYYVVNPYRPWSGTLEWIDRVLTEILAVSHLRFDRLELAVNPNLGEETRAEDVPEGVRRLEAMLEGRWPIRFVSVEERYAAYAEAELGYPILPLRRYLAYPWENRKD